MNDRVENPFSAPVEAASASTQAVAQREVAEVQAAMVIAKRFPRDPKEAMDRILTACTRTGLAEQSMYQYARGGSDITGPSIRLAEELARGWGNIACGVIELSRTGNVSECMAYAWDLETNYRDEKRFQVKHWRDTKGGGYAAKDERDIYEIIANQGSRRKRACILAVIPGDVADAAVRQCDVTLKTQIDVTPEKVQKALERFEAMGVTKEMIEARIQRRIDSITPALFMNLWKIYNSLRDGMSTVADWFDAPKAKATTLADINKRGEADKADPFGGDEQPAYETKPKGRGKKKPEPEPEPEAEPAAPSADELHARIKRAKNEDDVAVVMDLLRDVQEPERTMLKRAAVAKMQELVA